MNDIRMLTVAAALVLVAAACADDAADTTQPVSSPVTVPSTTTVTTGAAGGEDETTVDDTTTTQATEAPEETTDDTTTTTEPTEAPEETTDDTTTTTEAPEETTDDDTTTTEATEAPEETTDDDTTTTEATEAPEETTDDEAEEDIVAVEPVEDDTTTEATEAPEEIQPDRVVVWEGVDSEDRCAVAGGVWTDTGCEYWVFDDPADAAIETYWHPTLINDVYNAVNPETVDADHSESFDTRGTWGIHNYHVFYHYNDFGDPQVQYESMREAMTYGVRSVFTYVTDWVWFPHRYDVSWSDVPNVVAITGTYPLGEQRTLLLRTDSEQRSGPPNIELPLPAPPPIRPTTPFTQPLWDGAAEPLGRDCPPVEEIWDGYGTEVTDPCTLKAIETAVDWMWRGDAPLRTLAIRDGNAMIDFLQELESFEDPHENALLGYESRVNGATFILNIKWAGQWPGASMISLRWNIAYTPREFTPEEYEARVRYRNYQVEHGYDVVDNYLDLSLGEVFWKWTGALIVRTQDGTWRMSQRSFCWWYEKVIRIDQEELLCPDDPNPHFPDSAWLDSDIYPPSHKNYYQDPRNYYQNPRSANPLESLPHHDRGAHRRTGQYLGVPPS